jgi:CBS domain-containing protein
MLIDLLYHPSVITARESETLLQAARRMARHNVSALPVVRQGELTGILTEHDVARALSDRADQLVTLVREYMTRGPVTVTLGEDSGAVARRMLIFGVRHLPVMADGELIGIVSAQDLLVAEALAPTPDTSPVPEWAMP